VYFCKYKSVLSLKAIALQLIEAGNLDAALKIIHGHVESIITEPLCTSQAFASRTLDDLCQHIGNINLGNLGNIDDIASPVNLNQSRFVYVVTKLQKSGGHTRVIEDFIKARPDAHHVILSTEILGRSDTGYLADGLSRETTAVFERAPRVNYHQRLSWLQRRLLEIQPQKVYLFNHHQDSVAVAAVQPEMKLTASFYHHGDHHLSLGVYLPHVEHIDPHPMGYHYCRDTLGVNNIYIPLTAIDMGRPDKGKSLARKGALTTCTAAKSNKIEIPYFVSYLELIPRLLAATNGRHIHIGRLTPWALYKIKRGMRRYGLQADRFIYVPWVPSVWKALHEYQVDLYLASFPYGGGLTLIEAMGAGIPVAIHRHIFSRVLSGIDLAYPGAFSWRDPEELLKYCASVTPAELQNASLSGRAQYEKFHSWQILQRILNDDVDDYPKPADLSDKYSVDIDEWVLWMERQLTIHRVISRTAYRTFRRIRSWW